MEQEHQQPPQPFADTYMADGSVLPPPFTGKPTENPSNWFRQFTNYTASIKIWPIRNEWTCSKSSCLERSSRLFGNPRSQAT